ncbi:MAG: hypothetical protein NUV77_11270 [Thermoguttaceae bacterium]|jgi:hypothetical protein|nr:hypothetical protein [Thermoguttaceae bacterium]
MSYTSATSQHGTPNTPSVDELLDQVTEAEKLDPAARERLAADLRQTDPALWPAVVQAFRAALAYRRQMDQRRAMAQAPQVLPAGGTGGNPPASPGQPAGDTATPGTSPSARLSPPDQPAPQAAPTDASPKQSAAEGIEPASYRPASLSWKDHLMASIAALETELREAEGGEDAADKHARLRMLSLAAGRRDEALRPIPGAPPGVQDFWRRELYGLGVWLDAQRVSDASRRAGEAREQLAAALVPLGSLAPLVLRNLTFITQVQSYGDYKPFAKCEFLPDEEALLYVEIENFTSEETPKGFQTALEGSYRIFDSRNQQVAERHLGTTEETCRNPRRDFFLVYHLRIPKRIYAGKHTLQLTVVDLKSKKVGQSSVEFSVKDTSN